jgi:hypothetical protein
MAPFSRGIFDENPLKKVIFLSHSRHKVRKEAKIPKTGDGSPKIISPQEGQ